MGENLLDRLTRESMASTLEMATYYKPSVWRGKRRIYRSTDPAEPKREMIGGITFFVVAIIFFAAVWLLFR